MESVEEIRFQYTLESTNNRNLASCCQRVASAGLDSTATLTCIDSTSAWFFMLFVQDAQAWLLGDQRVWDLTPKAVARERESEKE